MPPAISLAALAVMLALLPRRANGVIPLWLAPRRLRTSLRNLNVPRQPAALAAAVPATDDNQSG